MKMLVKQETFEKGDLICVTSGPMRDLRFTVSEVRGKTVCFHVGSALYLLPAAQCMLVRRRAV